MTTRYKRPDHDADLLENLNTEQETNEEVSSEEATYRKRYSDLRSYSQKQLNDKEARIAELEKQIKDGAASTSFPKTEAEVDAWMQRFPDVAAIVKTIAMKEVSRAREDVDTRFQKLDKKEKEDAKRTAQQQLHSLHPDFFTEIIESQDFHDWITSKSKIIQDALYVNETDVQAAADVISLYKAETKYGQKKRKTNDSAAQDVNVRSGSSLGDGSRGKTYRESDIAKMNAATYEREEADIDAARASGRIIYDLSNAE